MSGGGSSRTAQSNELPPELRPVMSESGKQVQLAQNAANLPGYMQANPQQVAGRTSNQQRASAAVPSLFDLAQKKVTGANIQSSPSFKSALEAYNTAIDPTIVNSATLAGLGRTTALPMAQAQAKAQYLQPTIESELAREERGNQQSFADVLTSAQAAEQIGAQERSAQQDTLNAAYSDYLRRQALAEEAVYQPFGLLAPSTVGSTSKTSGSSGLFK